MNLSKINRKVYKLLVQKFKDSNYAKNSRLFSTKPSLSTVKDIGPYGLSLLIIPVSTFFLGNWQVKRRKWKLGLIEELKAKSTAPPIDLMSNLDQIEDLEYKKVSVKGKFDHGKEIYISPRSKLIDGDTSKDSGGLISSSANTGLLVITPFHVEDSNQTILVNRGWIPKNKLNPRTRMNGQVENTVKVVGVVRKTEPRPPFISKNNPGSKFWQYRDIDNMAKAVECDPIFIDADFKSTFKDGPIGGQTKVSLRNDHFSYILTWYSLSILTGYLWYQKFSPQLKHLIHSVKK